MLWKLKNNKDYYSTFAELEISCDFKKKLQSMKLEPNINGKKPDIVGKFKGKKLFLEIKYLGRAKRSLSADITVTTLSSHTEIPIYPCGKVFKIMKGDELQEVKKKVIEKCRLAINTKTPQECNITNKIKFYFVPVSVKNRSKIYRIWCSKQSFFGYQKENYGGLLYPNDKVSEEKRQRRSTSSYTF